MRSPTQKSPTHLAALEYASRNWFVFPIEEPRAGDRESGKRPMGALVPNGKDDATVDPRVIDAWFSAHPNANLGIALDKSKLVVLDVDTGLKKDGTRKQGRKSLEEFDAQLELTTTAITGGGGLHILYQADDGAQLQALNLRDGLDVIGKGYIVAAPSRHYTGGVYRWHDTRPPAPLPQILRAAVATRAEAKKVQLTDIGERTPIGEGGRNAALFRLGAALRDSNIGAQALAAALHWENQQRCNPPLPDHELALIVDSILKRVHPSRDVAAAAVVAEDMRQALAPPSRTIRVGEGTRKGRIPMRFYPTGIPDLDRKIGGGLATRQVFGIVAPPSVGKSAFVGSILLHLQSQIPVFLFSTELPRDELEVRFACARLGIPWIDGIKGLVTDQQIVDATAGLRIHIMGCDDFDRENPLACVAQEAELLRQQYGIMPALAVDYVQMLARTSDDKMRSKVGELTMGLRVMSQQLDTIVMAVFATKRDFYGNGKIELLRESDNPTVFLSAAKESGDIEFDCATLVYLDVDQAVDGPIKPARIAIARCRVGSIGFVGMRARLDVGVWSPDPQALVEMTTDAGKERKNLATVEKDMLRVFELVQRMPGRPWRDLRIAAALGSKRADMARAALLEAGRLELRKETFFDQLQRKQHREILVAIGSSVNLSVSGNSSLLASVPQEEDET